MGDGAKQVRRVGLIAGNLLTESGRDEKRSDLANSIMRVGQAVLTVETLGAQLEDRLEAICRPRIGASPEVEQPAPGQPPGSQLTDAMLAFESRLIQAATRLQDILRRLDL